ncbi:sensor histidine kinase [Terrimonas sp. NA20]|uniref:histidine kinase n=1 Tax=Terrimonas ginsenosidimutans TaxID=2908004 RepID=A0ABS9KV17_9BACT|nr:sensor histidine kinase [Terrimonas ginsenosidimutans]MCG2616173.1 sensor histidine kinase [Terrimonas ginsenosidimutans]
MKRVLICFLMLSLVIPLAGNAQAVADLKADSLMHALSIDKTDTGQINTLFELADHYMLKPGEYPADLDKANRFINESGRLIAKRKSDDLMGNHLLQRSQLARELKQYDRGKKLAEEALAVLLKGTNKLYLGNAYLAVGGYYHYEKEKEYEEKIRLTNLAVEALSASTDRAKYAATLVYLADLYILRGKRQQTIELLDRALLIYQSIGYTRLSAVYIMYASAYFDDANFKKSIQYSLMALKDAKAAKDSTMTMCQINNRIGVTYTNLKEPEKSIGYFIEALEVAKRLNDNEAVLTIAQNVVNSYIYLDEGKKALHFLESIDPKFLVSPSNEKKFVIPSCYLIIYTMLKDYPRAERYGREVFRLMELYPPLDNNLHNFYHSMSRLYIEKGDYVNASVYVRKLDSLSGKMGQPYNMRIAYLYRFRLDTAMKRYSSAIDNILAYNVINDSIYTETSKKQIQQLEVEYETENARKELRIREQDILMLRQRNELQDQSAKRANLLINITITGIVILLLVFALVYRQYKLKKRVNGIISVKNDQLQHLVAEKEWLIKEIHHRVKNNFQVVSSLLEIQSSYPATEDVLSSIKESQHRIYSMSLVHQKLYQSEMLSFIHMPEYVRELIEYLQDSFGIRGRIMIMLEVEQIRLNHSLATNLGLILNECVTNSIKYAFPGDHPGKIRVMLKLVSASELCMVIQDDGKGINMNQLTDNGGSMGMDLLQGLTEEIGGYLNISSDKGTRIEINFNLPEGAIEQG